MSAYGTLSFTITGGVAGAVTATGATLSDGNYTIELTQDNTGTTLVCVTPYGVTQQSGFDKGDDIE